MLSGTLRNIAPANPGTSYRNLRTRFCVFSSLRRSINRTTGATAWLQRECRTCKACAQTASLCCDLFHQPRQRVTTDISCQFATMLAHQPSLLQSYTKRTSIRWIQSKRRFEDLGKGAPVGRKLLRSARSRTLETPLRKQLPEQCAPERLQPAHLASSPTSAPSTIPNTTRTSLGHNSTRWLS